MKEASLLLAWLRSQWKNIAVAALLFLLSRFVFALYQLPVEPIRYVLALTLTVGLVCGGARYRRFRRRALTLRRLREEILQTTEHLPPPADLCEGEYQSLLRRLAAEKDAVRAKSEAEFNDLVDYYTLWVHQVKTPIAAMRLLLQSRGDEQGAELEIELLKIEQYVDMVLQYLRLDSDSTDLVVRRCALDDILRQALRKNARLFIRKKLRLDFRETQLTVLTDEKWLLFVIEQLLSNALKYTPEGGTITIEKGSGASLVLRDSGIGIAAEDLPRVCEKGFTGYNGRLDKKSTGIGLYLCRRILSLLHHSITITSQVGTGTTVTLGLDAAALDVE